MQKKNIVMQEYPEKQLQQNVTYEIRRVDFTGNEFNSIIVADNPERVARNPPEASTGLSFMAGAGARITIPSPYSFPRPPARKEF